MYSYAGIVLPWQFCHWPSLPPLSAINLSAATVVVGTCKNLGSIHLHQGGG